MAIEEEEIGVTGQTVFSLSAQTRYKISTITKDPFKPKKKTVRIEIEAALCEGRTGVTLLFLYLMSWLHKKRVNLYFI